MEDVEPENITYLHDALKKMCTRIGDKLKTKALRFKTVTVKIRYEDYSTIQRSRSIPVESDETALLEKVAIELFDQKRNHNKSIRLIGVKASQLSEASEQLCLSEFL
jgi:DNA polymerase-4